jgi:hypothetical protein
LTQDKRFVLVPQLISEVVVMGFGGIYILAYPAQLPTLAKI